MSFSEVFKKVTPWIATVASLAPIPGAPLIGMAAKALSAGLSTDVKPTADSISQAITTAMANPDQLAKLKQIDDDFAVQMKTLGIQQIEDLQKLAADDTANARAREIATKDWFTKVLAAGVVLACLTGEALYFFHGTPSTASPELIGRILGTLDTALTLVLGYYFGSSAGSAAKTAILAQNGKSN
jgi:hypothetical protein